MARHRTRPLSILLLTLIVLAAGSVPEVGAEVRISEVLSAPASDWNGDGEAEFKGDEWVEIHNPGPTVEVLDGLYLKDGTGDAYHYGFTGTLAPGEALVIYGSDAVAWQAANDAGSSGLSLNNGGDGLELWRDLAEPRVLQAIDVIAIPAHAADADRALGWSETAGAWLLHDGLNPYAGELTPLGTGCAPTPGQANDCQAGVPVESTGWGRVKAHYGPSRD